MASQRLAGQWKGRKRDEIGTGPQRGRKSGENPEEGFGKARLEDLQIHFMQNARCVREEPQGKLITVPPWTASPVVKTGDSGINEPLGEDGEKPQLIVRYAASLSESRFSLWCGLCKF